MPMTTRAETQAVAEQAWWSQRARLEAMIASQSELIARQAKAFAAQQASVGNVDRRGIEAGIRSEGQSVVGPALNDVGPTEAVGDEGPTVVPSGRGDRGTGDGTHEFVTSLLTLRSPPARGDKNRSS